MAKAIEAGIPSCASKRRGAHAGAHRFRQQAVIGVNKFRLSRSADLGAEVDNAASRPADRQAARLRAERNEVRTQAALEALTAGARRRQPARAVDRSRARHGERGEMSLAIEKAFGRHVAQIRSMAGSTGGRRIGVEAIERVLG